MRNWTGIFSLSARILYESKYGFFLFVWHGNSEEDWAKGRAGRGVHWDSKAWFLLSSFFKVVFCPREI